MQFFGPQPEKRGGIAGAVEGMMEKKTGGRLVPRPVVAALVECCGNPALIPELCIGIGQTVRGEGWT